MRKRYVITGGGGFVGKALGQALREQGHEVVSLSRRSHRALESLGIESVQVDIGSEPAQWQHLFKDVAGVFHTAAKVDMWGAFADFFHTNVVGTRNVIAACRAMGVRNLVFTSSPSVIHDGTDLEGIDESYAYPRHFDAFYPQTKAQAEQDIRAANDGDKLRTVSVRPHLIWGPGDTNLIPTIVDRARAGRLIQIGPGDNRVDLTFIDDCVQAHILAMQALELERSHVYGRVYFISQGEPTNMWGWINEVLLAHGLPRIQRRVSKPVAMSLAYIMEGMANVLRRIGVNYKPLLTRFLVSEMSTHHYFSIEAARRDLGYQPSCSIDEAMRMTFGVSRGDQLVGNRD